MTRIPLRVGYKMNFSFNPHREVFIIILREQHSLERLLTHHPCHRLTYCRRRRIGDADRYAVIIIV